MPSGKVHDVVALSSIIPLFLAGQILIKYDIVTNIVFVLSAVFSQLMFGPDLDLNSMQYKRWGFLRPIWLPYRIIFRHRSRFSHGLVFGPILRCLYLLSGLLILLIGMNFLTVYYWHLNFFACYWPVIKHIISFIGIYNMASFLLTVITGLFTGAAIHTLTDKTVSFFKNLI